MALTISTRDNFFSYFCASWSVGMRRALGMLMALPYPYEVELGKLRPARPAPRAPFDVVEHLLEQIRPAGDELEMFGHRLSVPEPYRASELAWLFRDALIEHFHKHRPDADSATWELFVSQARALLDRNPQPDAELLRTLVLTIDGL